MRERRTTRYGNGGRPRRIHLVAPKHPDTFWSMVGTAEMFGAKALMPNAALATVMALTPPGMDIEYTLCDENVEEIDFDVPCDLVGVTGYAVHGRRIQEIIAAYRERGREIAIGGPYASLEADQCKDLADYHFIGEVEYTWPRFLQDWARGEAAPVYEEKDYVDVCDSPAPDWSLVDPSDYLNLMVQTSRGCPFRCDFCDVIQYVGRKFRTKTIKQIMVEVKNAHALGARSVFFSDDNFIGNKKFVRELLTPLVDWNAEQTAPLSFSTQVTVQVADDEALLQQFADARFSVLFLGVETVRKASLREVHKSQNLKTDLHRQIMRVSRMGIVPFLGLIVGFDADDRDVFDDLYDFIEETASPIAGISLLNAPRHTTLHSRLKKEGRLASDGFSGEWQLDTNIIPVQMSRDELLRRYWALFQRVYEPAGFEKRLERWLDGVGYFTPRYTKKKFDPFQLLSLHRMVRYFLLGGAELRGLFLRTLTRTWRKNPRLLNRAFTLLAQYSHFYDFTNRPMPIPKRWHENPPAPEAATVRSSRIQVINSGSESGP